MKKLFSILSAAVIVLSVAAVMVFAVGDGKNRGDVNGDGKIDSCDAVYILRIAAGLKVPDAETTAKETSSVSEPTTEETTKPTTENTTKPTTENTTKPTEPVTEPTRPATKPSEPVTKPTEPATTPTTVDSNWDPSKNAVIDWGGGTTKKN